MDKVLEIFDKYKILIIFIIIAIVCLIAGLGIAAIINTISGGVFNSIFSKHKKKIKEHEEKAEKVKQDIYELETMIEEKEKELIQLDSEDIIVDEKITKIKENVNNMSISELIAYGNENF